MDKKISARSLIYPTWQKGTLDVEYKSLGMVSNMHHSQLPLTSLSKESLNGHEILTTGLLVLRSSKMFASSKISKYISTKKKKKQH